MGLRFTDLMKETKEITVAYGGETLKVTYRVNGVTMELIGLGLVEEIAKMVQGWDLWNDDGSQYPIEVEALRKLPIDLLKAISQAISDDLKLDTNEKKG